MNIVSDSEVIRFIHQERGGYAAFVGAGASAEAGVPTSRQICDDILDQLKTADPARDVDALLNELKWSDSRRRYSACLSKYGNDAQRVEYFRRLLRGRRPAFSHHATALLMRSGVLKRTCLTTNFDKLIEVAFAQQDAECQPIRMPEEARFWQSADPERYYTVKLHGDYDTSNILNTRDETLRIHPELHAIVERLLGESGMIVLGSGGFEESVVNLFNEILSPVTAGSAAVRAPLGVYWGVYCGMARPPRLTEADAKSMVTTAINAGAVSDEVQEMMQRADTRRRPCAFFPIWGAGSFLFRVAETSSDRRLIGSAELYLDHEMRLRNVFKKAGLSDDAINRHLSKLSDQRKRIDTLPTARLPADPVCTARRSGSNTTIRVLYGDITSRKLMAAESGRRAVISAEDTSVSAGGGVAYSLLTKAGPHAILNELSKLAPIEQGDVAVTSGGELPVQYIFHGAALRIEKDATYSVTTDDVSSTILSALRCAGVLRVSTVLVPLIGAGVGPLTPRQSFEAIVSALLAHPDRLDDFTLVIVVFKESQLPRTEIMESLRSMLGAEFTLEAATPLA
jgi:O-acetyl-ADP-ribose deacetylase (regulator of RNase III)